MDNNSAFTDIVSPQQDQQSAFTDSQPISTSQDQQSAFTDAIPQDVTKAQNLSGKTDFNGLCQAFVEKVTKGHENIYPSASSAWNSYAQSGKAKQGLTGSQEGDIVYFADPNQPNGHTGILLDPSNGTFISATDNGVATYKISDWEKRTGQNLLGYVTPQ